MLQDLITSLHSSLKRYSKGLSNRNLLVEIPWTMVDGDLNLQRLIFRKDNSLYIVKEGEIQESKWEYLPAMNSLVIEVGGKKILMNEVFADGKALILKRDGMALDFLSFANQNELKDLNLSGYLQDLHKKRVPLDNVVTKEVEETDENYIGIFVIIAVVLIIIVLELTK